MQSCACSRVPSLAGLPELKVEIAKQYPGLTTDDVLVTSGGSEAIFAIYAALCKPGDHMVCEVPNYPSNYGIPEGIGMETSLCSMDFEDGYRLNLDKIKSMVKENTKVLSITHPNNPTGCVISEAELRDLCAFCAEKDIYLLSDET
jgi:aspartate/methionine/tyrosine aminotransferase